MARKYESRGPKCPVCKAVMHPGKDGVLVCAFTDSHENSRKAQLTRAQKAQENNRKKS